jgi:hypothetical protein
VQINTKQTNQKESGVVMEKHSDIIVVKGDELIGGERKAQCHRCGADTIEGGPGMRFGSIRRIMFSPAKLSWCVLCRDCGLLLIDFVKPIGKTEVVE